MTGAIAFALLGIRLTETEAVLALTVYFTRLISVIWGLTLASPAIQLLLGLMAVGLNQAIKAV